MSENWLMGIRNIHLTPNFKYRKNLIAQLCEISSPIRFHLFYPFYSFSMRNNTQYVHGNVYFSFDFEHRKYYSAAMTGALPRSLSFFFFYKYHIQYVEWNVHLTDYFEY